MCRADNFNVPIVLKSGSLSLLEPSGPVQACSGIDLPLIFLELFGSFYWTMPISVIVVLGFCGISVNSRWLCKK